MLSVREIEDSDRLVNAEHHFGATGLNFRNRKKNVTNYRCNKQYTAIKNGYKVFFV